VFHVTHITSIIYYSL
jgi:hypothetical protein